LETFDILHAFLPLNVAKLLISKTVRFLAYPVHYTMVQKSNDTLIILE